jgi:hypothetical protein
VQEHRRERSEPSLASAEHTDGPGPKGNLGARCDAPEQLAGNQRQLAHRPGHTRLGTEPLNEDPDQNIHPDDAERDKRGDDGGIIVLVREHSRNIDGNSTGEGPGSVMARHCQKGRKNRYGACD